MVMAIEPLRLRLAHARNSQMMVNAVRVLNGSKTYQSHNLPRSAKLKPPWKSAAPSAANTPRGECRLQLPCHLYWDHHEHRNTCVHHQGLKPAHPMGSPQLVSGSTLFFIKRSKQPTAQPVHWPLVKGFINSTTCSRAALFWQERVGRHKNAPHKNL
jgi:hypothetical protein